MLIDIYPFCLMLMPIYVKALSFSGPMKMVLNLMMTELKILCPEDVILCPAHIMIGPINSLCS